MPKYWLFELIKLSIPFFVAFTGAWFAVFLALRRYKRERIWDRELQSYYDLIYALSELLSIDGVAMDEAMGEFSASEDYQAELRRRAQVAQGKLDEVSATAYIFLPNSIITAIQDFKKEVAAARTLSTYIDFLEDRISASKKLMEVIKPIARKHAKQS